jgi:hypothetical protein
VIWIVLAAVGVPLWLCALAIFVLIRRNSWLRSRPGNIPVRIRRPGEKRWLPGHGVWIHDVFAFRGSPAAWKEALLWVTEASARQAGEEERKRLRRLGAEPIVATFTVAGGGAIDFAARAEHGDLLLGGVLRAAPPASRASTAPEGV